MDGAEASLQDLSFVRTVHKHSLYHENKKKGNTSLLDNKADTKNNFD